MNGWLWAVNLNSTINLCISIYYIMSELMKPFYSAGSCKVNITCDCDKDKEKDKPEKQAALFAKEFQDKLYKTIFTKDKDDNDPPTNKSIVAATTPATGSNHTNCSNDAQVRRVMCHRLGGGNEQG